MNFQNLFDECLLYRLTVYNSVTVYKDIQRNGNLQCGRGMLFGDTVDDGYAKISTSLEVPKLQTDDAAINTSITVLRLLE